MHQSVWSNELRFVLITSRVSYCVLNLKYVPPLQYKPGFPVRRIRRSLILLDPVWPRFKVSQRFHRSKNETRPLFFRCSSLFRPLMSGNPTGEWRESVCSSLCQTGFPQTSLFASIKVCFVAEPLCFHPERVHRAPTRRREGSIYLCNY